MCSLSIIKTNQPRAACCLAALHSVRLLVCPRAIVSVFICLNSERRCERLQQRFNLSTY